MIVSTIKLLFPVLMLLLVVDNAISFAYFQRLPWQKKETAFRLEVRPAAAWPPPGGKEAGVWLSLQPFLMGNDLVVPPGLETHERMWRHGSLATPRRGTEMLEVDLEAADRLQGMSRAVRLARGRAFVIGARQAFSEGPVHVLAGPARHRFFFVPEGHMAEVRSLLR